MQINVKTRLKNIENRLGEKTEKDKCCFGFAYRNLRDGKRYDENGNEWVRPENGKGCEHFIVFDKPINDISEIPIYNKKLGRGQYNDVQTRQN